MSETTEEIRYLNLPAFRAILARANLTQKSAAERAGLHPMTINKWTTKVGDPTLSSLAAVVRVINEELEKQGQRQISYVDLLRAEDLGFPKGGSPIEPMAA